MKIYKDIFSEDELSSDSFPLTLEDDVVYKIETKLITKTEDGYDMAGDGAGEETYDSTSTTVNNLVDAHRLVETSFTKASYMTYIKGYMRKLKTHLEQNAPDRVQPFMKGAQEFIKKVVGDFSEYQFFTGESMNPDGMVVLMRYSEDGQTPFVYIFKDGCREEKY
ncbi:Translationally-controlled tumor protein [Balamuthia mandrillaris]